MVWSRAIVTSLITLAGLCQAQHSFPPEYVPVPDAIQGPRLNAATEILRTLETRTDQHLSLLASLDAQGLDLTPAFEALKTEIRTADAAIIALEPAGTTWPEGGARWSTALCHTWYSLYDLNEITPQINSAIVELDKTWYKLEYSLDNDFNGIFGWTFPVDPKCKDVDHRKSPQFLKVSMAYWREGFVYPDW